MPVESSYATAVEVTQSPRGGLRRLMACALGMTVLLGTATAAAIPGEEGVTDEAENVELPAYDVTPWLDDGIFDLQAHRGGMALVSESTRESFARGLETGVTTLELDTHVTADGAVLVWHDRQIFDHLCRDTGPVEEGDPDYPYVGEYIRDLTLEQVQTLECGYQPHEDWPDQQLAPGPLLELEEVFDLIHEYEAYDVMLNIETKVEAGAPEETQPRDVFVPAVIEEIEDSGLADQVTIQSFDWGALQLVEELHSDLPRVALTNYEFLELGEPGASPWLGGLNADDYDGDLVAMADELGVEAISPVHGFPQDGEIADEDYEPYVTEDMVDAAHEAGISVIPWTINDVETMAHYIETGVDGMITDRPDALRELMDSYGMRLPQQYFPVSADQEADETGLSD